MKYSKQVYRNRFPKSEHNVRNIIWEVLCEEYFGKYINGKDTVIDIGAGYCEFINNISSKKKIAVDINPDTKKYADRGVEVIIKDVLKIPKKYYGKADVVFMSNFLEHLDTKDLVIDVLKVTRKLLKKSGDIFILQPNIDLAKEKYWDCIDHKLALNAKSVREALELSEFTNIKVVERFLPLSTKARLPKNKFLVKLYLQLPEQFRPLAAQSLFTANK